MSSNPSSTVPERRRKRRIWPWIVGIGIGCVVATVATVVEAFFLSRDAAALRRPVETVFAGTGIHRQVQLSAGSASLGIARTIVRFIDEMPPEAHQALAAIRAASVGVYELGQPATSAQQASLLAEADRAMRRRGRTRMVVVSEPGELVAIYADPRADADDRQRLCLLVCDHRELVIGSVTADPAPLIERVAERRSMLARD